MLGTGIDTPNLQSVYYLQPNMMNVDQHTSRLSDNHHELETYLESVTFLFVA